MNILEKHYIYHKILKYSIVFIKSLKKVFEKVNTIANSHKYSEIVRNSQE